MFVWRGVYDAYANLGSATRNNSITYAESCNNLPDSLKIQNFNYNGTNGTDGSGQTWTAPCSGKFKLEVWGAQGGTGQRTDAGLAAKPGGYGGYSIGVINISASSKLHVYIGGHPKDVNAINIASLGGFNGGGKSLNRSDILTNSGGGTTHISLTNRTLKEITYSDIKNVMIVAGGGGGSTDYSSSRHGYGGHGGGYIGGSGKYNTLSNCESYGTGGTQTSGGDIVLGSGFFLSSTTVPYAGFGYGSNGSETIQSDNGVNSGVGGPGGGGGLYGGRGGACIGGGGGGSGYIGNSSLISYGSITKHMTGYNLTNTTTTANIRTQTTTCVSATATADCAKSGHGAARITIIE